jgi:hypothetical protein
MRTVSSGTITLQEIIYDSGTLEALTVRGWAQRLRNRVESDRHQFGPTLCDPAGHARWHRRSVRGPRRRLATADGQRSRDRSQLERDQATRLIRVQECSSCLDRRRAGIRSRPRSPHDRRYRGGRGGSRRVSDQPDDALPGSAMASGKRRRSRGRERD